jgi:acyl-coenzyme A synthetase/AMP-(fatty) acid ligase
MATVLASLIAHAEAQPEALAYLDARQSLTYEAVRRGAAAAAAWLAHCGVRAGDTVAVSHRLTHDSARRAIGVHYGLAHLGAIVLPLYPDVPETRRAELARMFGARWLVATGASEAKWSMPTLDSADLERDMGKWLAAQVPRADAPERPFLYHFTSGTTGAPKACLFLAGQFAAWMSAAAAALGSSSRDRVMAARPWPEMTGLRALYRIHRVGGALVGANVPTGKEALVRLVRELGVTESQVSPYQLRTLLRSPPAPGGELAPLRALAAAGGFISPDEIRAARRTITPNFYADYGSNELGRIALLGPQDSPEPAGCVGRLCAGIEAEVVDDTGRPLPPGIEGALRFRAAWMPQGYAGNEQATAERFRDGWFYPGDIGSIDARGLLRVSGRTDEIINCGGLKISPSDLEAVLQQHPEVLDCAVVGVPHPESGQAPVAFVVLRRDVPGNELHDFCAGQVDRLRLPRTFVIVERIEHSAEGKILRDRLRTQYAALVARSQAQR